MTQRTLSPPVTCSFRRMAPRQVWVESLNAEKERYLDIVDLHPDVFATFPRLDLVHKNLYWQAHYRIVVSGTFLPLNNQGTLFLFGFVSVGR